MGERGRGEGGIKTGQEKPELRANPCLRGVVFPDWPWLVAAKAPSEQRTKTTQQRGHERRGCVCVWDPLLLLLLMLPVTLSSLHTTSSVGAGFFFFLRRKEHRGEARCKSHAGHDDDSDFGPIPSLQRCWRVLRDTFNDSQLALTGSGGQGQGQRANCFKRKRTTTAQAQYDL